MAAVVAKEGEEKRPEDIESSDAGGDGSDPKHPRRLFPGGSENGIFTEESGEAGEAGDGQTGNRESGTSDGHQFSEPSHMTEILFASKAVNNAAGA